MFLKSNLEATAIVRHSVDLSLLTQYEAVHRTTLLSPLTGLCADVQDKDNWAVQSGHATVCKAKEKNDRRR